MFSQLPPDEDVSESVGHVSLNQNGHQSYGRRDDLEPPMLGRHDMELRMYIKQSVLSCLLPSVSFVI